MFRMKSSVVTMTGGGVVLNDENEVGGVKKPSPWGEAQQVLVQKMLCQKRIKKESQQPC